MASGAVRLDGPAGSLVFPLSDSPEKIPLGGDLVYAEEVLSDGTRRLQVTGYAPAQIQLSGTFVGIDEYGVSALQKMDTLESMAASGLQHTFTWYGRSWPVTILKHAPAVVRLGDVDYSVVLHRATSGGLQPGTGAPGDPTIASARDQQAAHNAAISSQTAALRPLSQAAASAATTAFAQAQ